MLVDVASWLPALSDVHRRADRSLSSPCLSYLCCFLLPLVGHEVSLILALM